MGAAWSFLVQIAYLVCAGSSLALAGWLLARRGKRGPAAVAESAALALTACWALAFVALGTPGATGAGRPPRRKPPRSR